MNGFNAGKPSDPELELDLAEGGSREGSDGSSSGSTSSDTGTTTPGKVSRGDGDGDG